MQRERIGWIRVWPARQLAAQTMPSHLLADDRLSVVRSRFVKVSGGRLSLIFNLGRPTCVSAPVRFGVLPGVGTALTVIMCSR